MTFTLYDHQRKQNKAVRKVRKTTDHILYGASTGFGKSVVLWDMIHRDLDKGLKVLVLAPRRTLVKQLVITLSKYQPFMLMGQEMTGSYNSRLMISSIQTTNNHLKKKSKLYDGFDVIYIDETHIGCNFPPKPDTQFDLLYKKYWNSAKWIGLTATPITSDGYRLNGWDDCVYLYQTGDLIDMGYLAKYKYLAPTEMDTTKLKVNKVTNEFDVRDVEDAVINATSLKSLVHHTLSNFTEYKTKAMVFCISIEHAKQVKKAFIARNLNTVVLITHSKMTDREQSNVLSEFSEAMSAILINVSILTTGFDEKTVNLLVIGRPIRSDRLAIQIWGRGLRKHGNKVCTIVDLCSIHSTCGLPDDHRDFNRVKPPKKKLLDPKLAKEVGKLCQLCGELSPVTEWSQKKKVKSNFILIKWTCPSCSGITESRQDLSVIDSITEVVSSRQMISRLREDATGYKPLKKPDRYQAVKELITEFTRYKASSSQYCIREIRSAGNEDLLDYLLTMYIKKLAPAKETFKGVNKLWNNAKREIKNQNKS